MDKIRVLEADDLHDYITPNLEPEILTRKDPRAQEVFDYIKAISADQKLNVNFS